LKKVIEQLTSVAFRCLAKNFTSAVTSILVEIGQCGEALFDEAGWEKEGLKQRKAGYGSGGLHWEKSGHNGGLSPKSSILSSLGRKRVVKPKRSAPLHSQEMLVRKRKE